MVQKISLSGNWKFRHCGTDEWYPACVPGSVCIDLIQNGLMEDPFYRDNENHVLEQLMQDYEYTRSFVLEEKIGRSDRVELVFYGVDTLAQVQLNGETILVADNMHRTWRIDVKKYIREGENTLLVRFSSPAVYAQIMHREGTPFCNNNALGGFEYLRKAHSMFGWDWGPTIPDMGLFRPVEIQVWNEARISDCYVRQTHTSQAVELGVETSLKGDCYAPLTLQAKLAAPDGSVSECTVECTVGSCQVIKLRVENPCLWWPHGYGEQPLYTLCISLWDGEEKLDTWERRIGLRTVTVDTSADSWGNRFAVVVNGLPIFAMGANYIPEDSLLPRVTRDTSRKLLEQCVRANYNMIRVWGGGYYQDDTFYDLCDELGLLVWQDLLFACSIYHLTDHFVDSIQQETRDNLRRLRHHASIALWCGNNELEWAWATHTMGFPEDPHLQADYIKQFEWILPQIAKECDPDRFYWLASPSSGGGFDDPNDPDRGDVHFWEVWHGLKPFTEYRKFHFRFCSEFGFQSFPSIKTINAYTLPEDRNVFSDIMEHHQKNQSANGVILRYLSDYFLYPSSLEKLVYASELMQAEAIRYGVEHWRANRGRCMGSLYWQVNDCWPVASWSSIDYYGRWKPLHYYAKKFYAPLLCVAAEEQGNVSLVLCSESRYKEDCVVRWALRKVDGDILFQGEKSMEAPPLSTAQICQLDCTPWLATKAQRQQVYFSFELWTKQKMVSYSTILFVPPKQFRFAKPEISLTVREERSRFILTLRAKQYAKYVWLEHPDFDFVADDNCIDLVPGLPREIAIDKRDIPEDVTVQMLEQIMLCSAYDIR